MDIEFLKEKGINTDEGISYTGSREKYFAAIRRYCDSYDQNRSAVEEAYAHKDLGDLMVKVHGLKSNSRMIGAADMAKAFEELELSAKKGDLEYVLNMTTDVLARYDDLIGFLKPVAGEEKAGQLINLSREEALETTEKLIAALDEFDDSMSIELIGKLKGYPLNPDMEKKLENASLYIHDFLYDEAREIVTEISVSIKNSSECSE